MSLLLHVLFGAKLDGSVSRAQVDAENHLLTDSDMVEDGNRLERTS